MFKKGFFLLTLLVGFSISYGQENPWPKRVQELVPEYHFPFENQFASTVVGTCHSPNISFKDMVVPIQDWNVRTDRFEAGTLPVKVGFQRNREGKIMAAPVMFVIPGAFNNLDHKQPRRLLNDFTRLGYHTVVFPNPWGTQYISKAPNQATGMIKEEGISIYEVMRKLHRRFTRLGIIKGETKLFGVSYGAFLSSMIGGMDAIHQEPIVTGSVTMVSPPFNMKRALTRLDELLDRNRTFFGLDLVRIAAKFLTICRFDDQSEMGQDHLQDAEGLATGMGFHEELIASLLTYEEAKGLNRIPHRWLGDLSPVYRHWKRQMTFNKYFEEYTPEALEFVNSEEADLYYWIELARAQGKKDMRVLVAKDDFLNDHDFWAQSGVETILLPTGGHYGFRGLHWFHQFLKKTFRVTD